MNLAVTRAPDSHRAFACFFPVDPDGQSRGPDRPDVLFFVGFRTDFVTSVRVSVLPPEFWPGIRGGPKPQGTHPLRPLGYVPVFNSWLYFFLAVPLQSHGIIVTVTHSRAKIRTAGLQPTV